MSDVGRKSFTDKAKETITPEDQKSYAQQGKEYVTDTVDKVQSSLQPEGAKSSTQKAGDALTGAKDDAQQDQKTFTETASEYLEDAKHKLNEWKDSATEAINNNKK